MSSKRLLLTLLLLAMGGSSFASAASVREEKIDAEELAEELGFHVQKLVFSFDKPVYARADLVTVRDGGAIHLPLTDTKPKSKVAFACILHPSLDMLTLRLNGQATQSHVRNLQPQSAIPHRLYPKGSAPSAPSPAHPVYILLHWDPIQDREKVDYDMAPAEIARKMTDGYYVLLYFSETPFPKR